MATCLLAPPALGSPGSHISALKDREESHCQFSLNAPTQGRQTASAWLQGTSVEPLRVYRQQADTRCHAASGVATPQSGQVEQGRRVLRPVVVVDNYDSFTYNLCQYLGDLQCPFIVHRNDEISIDELRDLNPSGVLISPGPGTPDDSGISLDVVRQLGPHLPIFGVCMGLQCMGQAFGGNIVRAPGGVMHGKTSPVYHRQQEGDGLLGGLPNPFTACRYHSLVIERASFPEEELEMTAWTEDGLVMGVRHKKYRFLEGVQFHPESIITQNGKQIVANFVRSLQQHEALLESQGAPRARL